MFQPIANHFKGKTIAPILFAFFVAMISLWSSFFIFVGVNTISNPSGASALGNGIGNFFVMIFITTGFFQIAINKDEPKKIYIDKIVEVEKIVEVAKIKQVPLTKDVTKREGYVYIIRGVNTSWYKIGRSGEPDSRLRKFDVIVPMELEEEMLLKTEDMHSLEYKLHQIFADKRVDGEWFTLTPDDLHWLRTEFDKS